MTAITAAQLRKRLEYVDKRLKENARQIERMAQCVDAASAALDELLAKDWTDGPDRGNGKTPDGAD